jgi:putative DNA primase/helicase
VTKGLRTYPASHITLQQVAVAVNGHIVGREVRCPGPGHSQHDDSLAIALAPGSLDGFVVHSHAGDDWQACKNYVRTLLGIRPDMRVAAAERPLALPARRSTPLPPSPALTNSRRAADLWGAAIPARNSPIEGYFRCRFAGREAPRVVMEGGSLRWHGGERIPGAIGAMLALMTNPVTGEPTGVHRTYLDPDLKRMKRMMLGPKGIVRLWPDDAVTMGLAIGEGIESTLAGAILTGRLPAWAALDAGQLADFPVLGGIECLTVFVDNDLSRTGQVAADRCAARWAAAGVQVDLLTPRHPADFNDLLGERSE